MRADIVNPFDARNSESGLTYVHFRHGAVWKLLHNPESDTQIFAFIEARKTHMDYGLALSAQVRPTQNSRVYESHDSRESLLRYRILHNDKAFVYVSFGSYLVSFYL